LTDLTEFEPEELAVLNRTPTAVALAAAYAEQDGPVSFARELQAGLTAAEEAAAAFPDNAVIQLLAASMHEVDEEDYDTTPDPDQPGDEPTAEAQEVVEERSPQRSRASSLDLAAQSLAIMQERATLEEMVEFKHWLFAIADQVTIATRSGGFLGFGGQQVGEGEREYLEELRQVLELGGEDQTGSE
jgi:hypothetical protein